MEKYLQNVNILKDGLFSFEIVKVNLEISKIELEDLTILEKFIIKVIDKADKENISLVEKIENNKEIQYQKIAKILSIDDSIVSNNIGRLQILGLVKIEDNKLLVSWNENLRKWKKEIVKFNDEILYLEHNNAKEFLEATEREQQEFLKTLFSKAKEIKIISDAVEKVELNIKAILDNGEINIVFEKENKFFTLSDEVSQAQKLSKLTDKNIKYFQNSINSKDIK